MPFRDFQQWIGLKEHVEETLDFSLPVQLRKRLDTLEGSQLLCGRWKMGS